MAISAEHGSKFAALHRQWWRLHMSEKFSSGTITAYNQPTNQLYNGEITEGRSTSFTTWKYGTERRCRQSKPAVSWQSYWCTDKARTKTCISSGCLEKGIRNIYGNDFQSEYKPLWRPLHTHNFCKPAQHLSRVSLCVFEIHISKGQWLFRHSGVMSITVCYNVSE